MKKFLFILFFVLMINPFSYGAEKGWFKATKTDFPIDPQNLENPKYTIACINGTRCFYLAEALAVVGINRASCNPQYFKSFSTTNCRTILIPVSYVENNKWENKDDTEYYLCLYLTDPISKEKKLHFAAYHDDNRQLNFNGTISAAIKFKLKWENDNATIISGDKMIMATPDKTSLWRDGGRFDLVKSDDTTYTYYPVNLFMEKEIVEWNPGFRKQISMDDVMAGPAQLAIRDGYLSDIDNTISVMAGKDPVSIYLSGSTTDATTIKWMMEQESLSIEPAADYPELDYTFNKFDYPFYDTFKITPSPELIGKTFNFTWSRSMFDPDFSLTEAMVPGSTTLKIKIVPNPMQWSFNNQTIDNGDITVNYTPGENDANTFKVNYDPSVISAAKAAPLRPKNYGDYDALPEGFIRNDDGSISIANSPVWNFTSEADSKTVTLTCDTPAEDLPLNVFGNSPDLTVTVKPHKPVLEVEENAIPHKNGGWGDVYRITVEKGAFEPGTDSDHFARILIVPQFDTFDNAAAATAFYGSAPRTDVADSWLSPKWYQENGHEGFLPIMQWDEATGTYFCEIDPNDMTYEGWDGRYSYGNKLVSGHYKAYLVPSENPDHRQYGILSSEPADLYIHPTLHDMKLHLYQRDTKGGEAYWKDYDIENDFFTFAGPKATDEGETAYRHARLTPNSDYCEIWVESGRHRPAYPEGQIPGHKTETKAAKPSMRTAADNSLDGYTLVEPEDYLDLTQPADEEDNGSTDKFTSASIKLVKNGAISPAQSFYISKSGDSIITGIEAVVSDSASESGESEYFTPAGIKVSSPATPGIYIERRSGITRRIAVH